MKKRLFDFIISLSILIIISPVVIFLALIIKVFSGSPVIYKQERIGIKGKVFKLYKFRTMFVNADKIGTSVTAKNDSRVTPVGRFLRRLKLDELPQLINVLKGDMSFVGPRPDVPGYADKLQGEDRIILNVRPGITGPATLKYRNEEEMLVKQENPDKYNAEVIYPDKVRLNRMYAQNNSFFKDMKYILMTIFGRKFNG
jgi:lipopolysaccharide/colanic/teichoic acid biosynthesis glycosyltransferase